MTVVPKADISNILVNDKVCSSDYQTPKKSFDLSGKKRIHAETTGMTNATAASTMEYKPLKRQKTSNQIVYTKGNVYQLEQFLVVCNPYTGEKDADDTKLYNLVFQGIIPRCGVRPC